MKKTKTALAAVALLLGTSLLASAQTYNVFDYGNGFINVHGSDGYDATYFNYGGGFSSYHVNNPGGSYPYNLGH